MKRFALALLLVLAAASGCVMVDWAVDPVGCQTGSHEPVFPWYPHYLWDPPQRSVPYSAANSAPQAMPTTSAPRAVGR